MESLEHLQGRPTKTRQRPAVEAPTFDHPLAHVQFPSAAPVHVNTRQLGSAMLAWMTLVFGLCYVALPMTAANAGLYSGAWDSLAFNMPAFMLASMVAAVGAMVMRPTIKTDVGAARDPVVAAGLGGLLTWGVIHNTSSILVPFAAMGSAELATFIGMNVIEMGMIGMMLASFTRSTVKAFALGMWFQLLVLGIIVALYAL